MNIDLEGSTIGLEVLETLVLASKVGETTITLENVGETSMFGLMKEIYKGLIDYTEKSFKEDPVLTTGESIVINGDKVRVKLVKKSPSSDAFIVYYE